MRSSVQTENYTAVASYDAKVLSEARRSLENMPKITSVASRFFLELKNKEAVTVPNCLIYPLSKRFYELDLLKLSRRERTTEENVYNLGIVAGQVVTIAGMVMMCLGHSILMYSGIGLTGFGISCTGGSCYGLSNRERIEDPDLKEKITLQEEKIREVFVEALSFSSQNENGLKKLLESRMKNLKLNNAKSISPGGYRKSSKLIESYELALEKVNAMVAHFNHLEITDV